VRVKDALIAPLHKCARVVYLDGIEGDSAASKVAPKGSILQKMPISTLCAKCAQVTVLIVNPGLLVQNVHKILQELEANILILQTR
jgi:hypothetical protein